ncbi:Cleavage polyadenylation factor subunit clp1 [Mycoemilia scoparia]|uniref:Polynucleotide 5'-hydroxyl-kinase GRC3 n=1 Tax=Mycoemilia scoparia TaxID=417184 RepID=A0A9W7ZX53_9FUNG|nr:Cleavage polyadenylation factor subunit clp1 [Mycoemilia scoparia]
MSYSSAPKVEAVKKEWALNPGEEFRFEVDIKSGVTIKLLSGTAEIFGAELGSAKEYYFTGTKLAGRCSAEYVAEETPMDSYLNVHCALHQKRQLAADNLEGAAKNSPRIIVVGPADSGKTTFTRTMINYAVRQGIPGTISATPITHIIDPEDGFSGYASASSTAPPETPLVYQFGSTVPQDNMHIYKSLVSTLATSVKKRLSVDSHANSSGFIIDTHGSTGESSNDVLSHIVTELSVNIILVLGSERLFSVVKRQYGGNPDITILKLVKSGGVVSRDESFMHELRSRQIRDYFYGTHNEPFSSFSSVAKFSDLNIFQPSEGKYLAGHPPILDNNDFSNLAAPSSTLPLGENRRLKEAQLKKMEPDESLLHSLLSIQNLKPASDEAPSEQEIICANASGFVHVTKIDVQKERVEFLSPLPGRLPRKYLIYGKFVWIETL